MPPPSLDLSATYSHPDLMLSSRSVSRMSLRRAGSYNTSDRGPLSSTSSRFSFNHLLASPPASPSLPALIPRHGKPQPSRKPRKYFKGIIWAAGVLAILYYGFEMIQLGRRRTSPVGWDLHSGEEFEMVGDSELPEFPTPVEVTDKRGRAKWTVYIPPDHQFPLRPKQYSEICQQNMVVAAHVTDLHKHKHIEHAAHYGYYHKDKNFMDVAEAEAHGILPGSKVKSSMQHTGGSLVGVKELIEGDVCKTTMTFVMETSDAGLGRTLMRLWTAYGLAKIEGRSFFIDDTRWAYGKYTDYFLAPPISDCRPPPRHEMLPCPRQARHLIVSAATVAYDFGGAFENYYEDPKKMEVFRQQPIFAMARVGYEALFKIQTADATYATKRIKELRENTIKPMPGMEGDDVGMIIGIHVRHGDRRPYEFQYKDSYIPNESYTDLASDQLFSAFNTSGPNGDENLMAEMKSVMVVASDDPEVYNSIEFSHYSRAQEHIKLASKPKNSAKPSTANPRKFVAEAVGWEGGFFAGMFWSLGRPGSETASATDRSVIPTPEALRLRQLVGRAYLLDLAVLGSASDRIVCTVSSMGCRLLGVMMGWEKAIVKGAWLNIDGKFDWRGVEW